MLIILQILFLTKKHSLLQELGKLFNYYDIKIPPMIVYIIGGIF